MHVSMDAKILIHPSNLARSIIGIFTLWNIKNGNTIVAMGQPNASNVRNGLKLEDL